MNKRIREFGMPREWKIKIFFVIVTLIIGGVGFFWLFEVPSISTKSDLKDYSLIISKIAKTPLPVGKNLAKEMFKMMDLADGGVISGSRIKKTPKISEAEVLRNYNIKKNTANMKFYLKAYELTLLYTSNGGIQKKNSLITVAPDNWDGKPTKHDDSILNWRFIDQFEIR